MKTSILSISLLSVLVLSACSEGEQVSGDIVDQNQIMSRKNAELNAKAFARNRFPDYERVLVDSDSTVSTTCRFGDGWASASIVLKDGSEVAIKCQTNGSGKGYSGCLEKDAFMKKDYAKEEGRCNKSLSELVKLGQ